MTGTKSLAAELCQDLGLRCPKLIVRLRRCALVEPWGISPADEADDIRANGIWQVERVLGTMVDRGSEPWRAAALAFNFGDYDMSTRRLKLTERRRRGGPGMADSTVQRLVNDLEPELSERLAVSMGRPPEAEIRRIKDREAGQKPAGTADGLEKLIPVVYGRTWETVTDEFLNTTVLAPLGLSGKLVLSATRTKGKWVISFTRMEFLAAYQQVTRPIWRIGTNAITGAELVKRIHRASYHVGLLVNPPPAKGAGAGATLALSALEIAKLASRLEEGPK